MDTVDEQLDTVGKVFMEMTLGWPGEHPPYRTYDLNPDGSLKVIEEDPNFGAFAVAPTPAAEGELDWNLLVCEEDPMSPLAEKAMTIFDKVLNEVYLTRAEKFGGEVAIVTGYMWSLFYEGEHKGKKVSQSFFNLRMKEICDRSGALQLDLQPGVEELGLEKTKFMTWEQDFHLGPTGHYLMARMLFDTITKKGLAKR